MVFELIDDDFAMAFLVSIFAISADTNCLHPTVSGQGRIITMHVMRWEVSRTSQTAMERY